LRVAAGVLQDSVGRVLVSLRPVGKPQAGAWEFPGGKLATAETPLQALSRELEEELGIRVLLARHLLRYEHAEHNTRPVQLHVWRVLAWSGEPLGREGQALQWLAPAELLPAGLLPADAPIVAALTTAASVNQLRWEACLDSPR
jgi:8-oxo-dGTP diphosphatase